MWHSCKECRKSCRNKFCDRACFAKYWVRVVLAKINAPRKATRRQITCLYCGRQKVVQFNRRKVHYCSSDCLTASRKIPRRLLNCKTCGKSFETKIQSRKYCSDFCHNHRGLNAQGRRVDLICPVCKKSFNLDRGTYDKKKHREIRCSPECYRKQWLSKRQPNDGEKKLGKILKPFGFRYVGNGKLFVGSKNPDFVFGKNIIELFGHFHKQTEVKPRIAYLRNHGYRCLVIWYPALRYPEQIKQRVCNFLTT